MNFIRFATGTTNIFPIANSKTGGQLVTEFNIRSKDSVQVGPISSDDKIHYMVGQSFVNNEDDFSISVSGTALIVHSGRAIINGHFFESLVDVSVDIAEANMKLRKNSQTPLLGHLAVGLRAMYSTETTIAGSLKVENELEYFEGVQVVILPSSELKLPADCPQDQSLVTAHIKLGEFEYRNGSALSPTQNYPAKCQYLNVERIANVESLMSDNYISTKGLNPGYLYVFSGKGSNDNKPTWCNAVDSLIVWDKTSKPVTDKPSIDRAQFSEALDGNVHLYLPHKQVDGWVDSSGRQKYYTPGDIQFPSASYEKNSAGAVTSEYTKTIKKKIESIQTKMMQGKQRAYIASIADESRSELPPIGSDWTPGDYVLVGTDNSVSESATSNMIQSPSTMYIYIGRRVTAVKYASSQPGGTRLDFIEVETKSASDIPNTTDPTTYNAELGISETVYRGEKDSDYIQLDYVVVDDNGKEKSRKSYFYAVSELGTEKEYSIPPVFLTGEIPLATEDTIGGFLNASESYLDGGYVYRDENGHLRLLDYSLLRSGALAYQLGEDVDIGSGLTHESIQTNLDEYVNDRVAFPTAAQKASAAHEDMIDVSFELSIEDEDNEITIQNIDSRFGCGVYLHISGECNKNTVINIVNCERIRLDLNVSGEGPTLNLSNTCLFYDSDILNEVNYVERLSLWYTKMDSDDPNIAVNGMTVSYLDEITDVQEIDYWNEDVDNDIHYMYAVDSITFNQDGYIIGCGLLIKNKTTENVSTGRFVIVSEFELPQKFGFNYPEKRLVQQIKITGQFITAYPCDEPEGYKINDTKFTALSQYYNSTTAEVIPGTVSFLSDVEDVPRIVGVTVGTEIDTWATETFHPFEGRVIP